jgi:hypothetical protein
VLTDNRNRAAANVRSLFSKNGGNLGETGSVSFMFDRVGQIAYPPRPAARTPCWRRRWRPAPTTSRATWSSPTPTSPPPAT